MLNHIIQITVLMIGGLYITRFAGKKSISQMTFPTLIITMSIGSLLIQPLTLDNDVITTLIILLTMVFILLLIEWLQIRFNWFETITVGHSVTLVENGELKLKNLSKNRVTIDQLETFLREVSVKHYSECEWVTLEPNGKIGYSLKKDYKPLTYKQFNDKMNEVEKRITSIEKYSNKDSFKEVSQGKHDNPIDTKLE